MLLTIGRYIIRYHKLGRFHLDDAAHLLAFLTLIALCATFQGFLGLIYSLDNAIRKEGPELSKAQNLEILKARVVVSVLFWVCLYSVKFSFLLLYRMIFVVSHCFRVL